MKLIGQPFIIQNTSEGWIVTWTDAARMTDEHGNTLESVSFTVRLPPKADLTIQELQTFALKRAVELLQDKVRLR
jgi:hypothetical protein